MARSNSWNETIEVRERKREGRMVILYLYEYSKFSF